MCILARREPIWAEGAAVGEKPLGAVLPAGVCRAALARPACDVKQAVSGIQFTKHLGRCPKRKPIWHGPELCDIALLGTIAPTDHDSVVS